MDQQCKGITRSGTRCKISRNLKNGYCHLHINQAEQSDKEQNGIQKQDYEKEPVQQKKGESGPYNETEKTYIQKSGKCSDVLKIKNFLNTVIAVLSVFLLFSVLKNITNRFKQF